MLVIYVNAKAKPSVYKGTPRLPNETHPVFYFRHSTAKKLFEQQQTFHKQLSSSVEQLSEQLQASFSSHEEQHHHLYEQWMKQIQQDETLKQAILDSLTVQEIATKNLAQQVTSQEQLYQDLLARLESQEKLFQTLAEKLELQDVFHETIIKRLDDQEAVNHKVVRQLDNLKEIVFERCSYVVEKIETAVKQLCSSLLRIPSKKQDREQHEEPVKEIVHM
ncbi:hypothetical protein [Thermaerobacillus caldiproteolyticus]|uniref:DNA-binding transcriptional regulator YbjK n=1 Tax=Thermaerobacillus caldiproteolyticus TaxID=247480 RepID=A0A7V9Z799_9BACL|nr:hypothetical protein [Anoxybacillus caldiproteolyticus]MBA2875326.1 DNA-binding transcriptional regulator YbjK [Anoxybacillus caldiproteolyticus]QPA32633.1 hypothetical protein ISX45_06805 [Anoxybacillus caldiproteolyticus]